MYVRMYTWSKAWAFMCQVHVYVGGGLPAINVIGPPFSWEECEAALITAAPDRSVT